MPCPSHPPWLDHSNYSWRRVQVKNNELEKNVEGSDRGLIWGTIQEFACRYWGKTRRALVVVSWQIWIRHLPNIRQKCYCLSQLAAWPISVLSY
jgi:hypothetical protein